MKNTLAAVAVTLALSACGGGGGGGGGDDEDPQGIWSDDTFSLLVTPSGDVWGAEVVANDLVLYRGTVDTDDDEFEATGSAYLSGTKASFSAKGTVSEKESISGTVTITSLASSSFSATYSDIYDGTPSVASLAGTYSLNTGGSVTITSAGAFTGTTDGCSFTGTVTADSSGKNFYRLSVTFGAAPCARPNGTGSGVVAGDPDEQLLAGIVSGDDLGQAFLLTPN